MIDYSKFKEQKLLLVVGIFVIVIAIIFLLTALFNTLINDPIDNDIILDSNLCFNQNYKTEYFQNKAHVQLTKESRDLLIDKIKLNGDFALQEISDLTCITFLELRDLGLEDISSLKSLVNIKNLYLSNNNIYDITPIKDMKSLRLLEAPNNKISKIDILKELENLEVVVLINNEIEDLSVFNNKNFRMVFINGNKYSIESCNELKNSFSGERLVC